MSDVNALRKALFDIIEGIKNKTISIEQAKAIAETGQVIINSAKVEVEYAKATGGNLTSGFLAQGKPQEGIPGVTIHRIKG